MSQTRAEAAAELARLKQLLADENAGATDEWLTAINIAIRQAEARLRKLGGVNDLSDVESGPEPEPVGAGSIRVRDYFPPSL